AKAPKITAGRTKNADLVEAGAFLSLGFAAVTPRLCPSGLLREGVLRGDRAEPGAATVEPNGLHPGPRRVRRRVPVDEAITPCRRARVDDQVCVHPHSPRAVLTVDVEAEQPGAVRRAPRDGDAGVRAARRQRAQANGRGRVVRDEARRAAPAERGVR